MTTQALERAARAAADADAKLSNGPPLYANNPELYQRIARAVLMAVREPDEATCEAGNGADYYSSEGCDINFLNMDRHGDKPATGIVFTAMIDAILNDGEGE